jgi:hypothetical protein
MSTLNNYADVQNALTAFCRNVGVDPDSAPHGAFWNTMSYDEFIRDDIPNFEGVKVLIVGDAPNSNIIQILKGIGEQAGNYGPMPPGVPIGKKTEIIDSLSDWIVRKCPNR